MRETETDRNEAVLDLSNGREMRVTREFDAPRALVWRALTDPAHVDVWWGPDGFTNTTKKIDVRAGGTWVFVMHGPDGTDYDNVISYRELVAPERMVYRHGSTEVENPDEDFNTVVTLEDLGGRTRLTMVATFKEQAARDLVIREFGAAEGAMQHLQKLSDHLERMERMEAEASLNPAVDEARVIRMSRVFDAPRALVWKAWTDPEQVARWWGPDGFTVEIHTMDVRPGGTWHLTMHGPDGAQYPNKSVFKEVVKPERIVFAHAGGRVGGKGAHFVSTWSFRDVGENRTELEIYMVFDTVAEREYVVREFNAVEGARQTLGRLAEILETLKTGNTP
jgi:uncharacterized protein YndB with AHSA1/START domain